MIRDAKRPEPDLQPQETVHVIGIYRLTHSSQKGLDIPGHVLQDRAMEFVIACKINCILKMVSTNDTSVCTVVSLQTGRISPTKS